MLFSARSSLLAARWPSYCPFYTYLQSPNSARIGLLAVWPVVTRGAESNYGEEAE